MPTHTRSSVQPTDAETTDHIQRFLAAAVLPIRAEQDGGVASLISRHKGLKCLDKLPLYKELAAAVAERNACKKLFSKTEDKLKALDRKVQEKLGNIVAAKKKMKTTPRQ
jgi:hypothetical protein